RTCGEHVALPSRSNCRPHERGSDLRKRRSLVWRVATEGWRRSAGAKDQERKCVSPFNTFLSEQIRTPTGCRDRASDWTRRASYFPAETAMEPAIRLRPAGAEFLR